MKNTQKNIPGNAVLIKQINTRLVRKTLRKLRKGTASQLANLSGLTAVTVGTILQELIRSGEVFEGGLLPSMGGGPSREYCYNPDFSHVAYICAYEKEERDTFVIRVANHFKQTLFEQERQIERVTNADFNSLLDQALASFPSIRAIGLSLPGFMSGENLLSDYSDLNGDQFLKTLRQKYQIPIVFENDVNAACLGFCSSQEIDSETPVLYGYFPKKYFPGIALYLDGQLYRGYRNFVGEIRPQYFELDWTDAAFYENSEVFCPIFARFLAQISSIVSPERIILAGEQFTEALMQKINDAFIKIYDPHARPALTAADSFYQDCDNGAFIAAWQTLEFGEEIVQTI